ncbi:Putative NAD(P)H nitroreductase ydjA [Moraxella caprae]|uniref:Putative NAD(P)H nitroreductase n=1 Tax=Moraxella caprae TaxID=90240 RepID=A0A378R1P0_9GAMM|nr:nitroreductase [Moraxella caprae]STZ08918.1 Putative NAD(P)H nitroreductase ydjA [Moraxella caprae]
MNDLISLIHARRSIGKLSLPMPSHDELNTAFLCAMTAPDHKVLRPYRFGVMTGKALDEFGQVLLQAGLAKAEADGESLDDTARIKLINMPKRAPMIITVATDYKQHPKVPEFEQLLCVGAVVQNLLLALQSMGYRTVWRTGHLCNEPAVKAHFEVSDDNLVCGFVYVGSSDIVMPEHEEVDLAEFVYFYQ